MAYPTQFLRLSLSGPYYTVDRWTTGISIGPDFDTPGDPVPTIGQALIDACVNFLDTSLISSAVKLDMIKLNLIGTDGRYVDKNATEFHEFTGILPDGGGALGTWPQMTLAATLLTARSRGLASKGRMFLPAPMMGSPDANGQMASNVAASFANHVATFVNAVDAALPSGWRPSVMSNVREGASEVITGVQVGTVPDTQRRRRSAMEEVYLKSSVAVVPGNAP